MSNLSEEGIFIRTRQGFLPGTILDIEIYLPENRIARMKGKVVRTTRNPAGIEKNGMGIELIIKDPLYTEFFGSF